MRVVFLVGLMFACKTACSQFDTSSYYMLTALHSGKVVGVNAALNLVQWDYQGLERQKWEVRELDSGYVAILSARNGYCIEALPYAVPAGNVRATPYEGLPQQQWKVLPREDGYVGFINRANGLALDVMEAAMDNGWILLCWEFHAADNQLWKLDPLEDGCFRIIAAHSGKALTMTPSIDERGANVAQWEYQGQHWQHWKVLSDGQGCFRLINRHSGQALQLSDHTSTLSFDAEQGHIDFSDRQTWQITPATGGYILKNKASGTFLEVMVVAQDDGANVWTYEYNGGKNQIFQIQPVSN